MACFGVHVGCTSMCVALHRDGKTEVIADDAGDRTTTAALRFDGGSLECGSTGRALVRDVKRLIGDPVDDPDLDALNYRNECKVSRGDEGFVYESNESSTTAERALAELYGAGFGVCARAAPSEGELRVVTAVPYGWSQESRKRAVSAAELAGFMVLQTISETAAIALAYDVGVNVREEFVLVYRAGGSSCDAAVVRAADGLLSVEAYDRSFNVGGAVLTKDLADFVADEFQNKWKLDPRENRRSFDKLIRHAEQCKRALSNLTSSHLFVESLHEGVDWSQNVSRARFENVIAPRIDSLLEPARRALANSGFADKITKIAFGGGTAKIPKLQSAVCDLLPGATPLNGTSPDEAIARGCAKQASLALEFPNTTCEESNVTVDCIKYPILADYEDSTICIFPTGTPINHKTEVTFERKNKSMHIDLRVYERRDVDVPIGEYTFSCGSQTPKIQAVLNPAELTIDVV